MLLLGRGDDGSPWWLGLWRMGKHRFKKGAWDGAAPAPGGCQKPKKRGDHGLKLSLWRTACL